MDEQKERIVFEADWRARNNNTWYCESAWIGWQARAALAAAPAPAPLSKADRVHAIVDAGPYPGMSAAFDAHMGAECWTDPAYRQDAATWAAAWKAALRATAAPAPAPLTYEQIEALRCIDDCGEAAPEFSRIVRIAERAHGIGTDAAPAQHPDTADAMKEPKNGNDWHVVWCNESARLMLPGIDAARAHGIGTDAAPAPHPDTADAERYRWLREQHWSESPLCVVADPKEAVKVGHCCPSGEYLDIDIDAARAQAQKGE